MYMEKIRVTLNAALQIPKTSKIADEIPRNHVSVKNSCK